MGRLEDRFNKLRQAPESPIAYAGVDAELLSQLSTTTSKEVVEAMVRARAQRSHSDVVAGREEEIRELSPYFAILKDGAKFEKARQELIAERSGSLQERRETIGDLVDAVNAESSARRQFFEAISAPSGETIRIAGNICVAVPLNVGTWEFDILTSAAKKRLFNGPSSQKLYAESDPSDVTTFKEIPEEVRQWALTEAAENLKHELLVERENYATKMVAKKYPELAARVNVDNPTREDLRAYEHHCGKYQRNAPVSRAFEKELKAEAVRVYQTAGETFSSKDSSSKAAYLELSMPLISQHLTTVRSTEGALEGERGGRTVLGVLYATPFVQREKEAPPTATLEARAESGQYTMATDLRPVQSYLMRSLPVDIIASGHPEKEPYEHYWLISTGEDKSGKMRVWLEGRIFSARQVTA